MSRLLAWASSAGDRLNPVAVREFRQAVRSRWVVAVLLLFLLVNLVVVGGYLVFSPEAATSIDGGRHVFNALFAVLTFTCVGFVPAYTCVRLALERNGSNLDLLFVTTITPGAIVRGKYFSSLALAALIFSACMPFMTVTYLLRGIDLPTIFFLLFYGFLVCAGGCALGVFAGAMSGTPLFRAVVIGGALMALFGLSMMTIGVAQTTTRFGARTAIPDFWSGLAFGVLVELVGIGLLYVLSVALLSPKPSNRMLVPRIYGAATWLLTAAVAAVWSNLTGEPWPVLIWTTLSLAVFTVLLVAALGERDAWTARVRRTIPHNPVLRLGAFLFYTGSAGGMLWCALLFAATLLAAAVFGGASTFTATTDLIEVCGNASMVFGYALCYCLTTAILRHYLLRRMPTQNLPVVAVFLAVAVATLGYVAAFLLFDDPPNVMPWFLLGSPAVLGFDDPAAKDAAIAVLALWLLISVVGAVPWVLDQYRRFTPLRPAAKQDAPAPPLLQDAAP